jgi:hypothetical protein
MMRNIKLFPRFSMRGTRHPKKKSHVVLHASQRPAEPSDIDFSTLDLQFPMVHQPEVFLKRIGWSPPPTEQPDTPFQVSISFYCQVFTGLTLFFSALILF